MRPAAKAKDAEPPQRRIDPVDGKALTASESRNRYKGAYAVSEIIAYWHSAACETALEAVPYWVQSSSSSASVDFWDAPPRHSSSSIGASAPAPLSSSRTRAPYSPSLPGTTSSSVTPHRPVAEEHGLDFWATTGNPTEVATQCLATLTRTPVDPGTTGAAANGVGSSPGNGAVLRGPTPAVADRRVDPEDGVRRTAKEVRLQYVDRYSLPEIFDYRERICLASTLETAFSSGSAVVADVVPAEDLPVSSTASAFSQPLGKTTEAVVSNGGAVPAAAAPPNGVPVTSSASRAPARPPPLKETPLATPTEAGLAADPVVKRRLDPSTKKLSSWREPIEANQNGKLTPPELEGSSLHRMHANEGTEKRRDPADGKLYTHAEVIEAYERCYTPAEIRYYWEQEMLVLPKEELPAAAFLKNGVAGTAAAGVAPAQQRKSSDAGIEISTGVTSKECGESSVQPSSEPVMQLAFRPRGDRLRGGGPDTLRDIKQQVIVAHYAYMKPDISIKLMREHGFFASQGAERAIVFCANKVACDKVGMAMYTREVRCDTIYGDKDQRMNNEVLGKFQTGEVNVLVTTDQAIRGMSLQGITLVVNYDLPYDKEGYVRRLRRVDYAAAEGERGLVVTLPTQRDATRIKAVMEVMRRMGQEITEETEDLAELAGTVKERIF